MRTTLLIMAAGLGSRFGTGIKQLETVDSNGHIIMDYSIHDAIEAGFNKIVFIIRKDIEKEFKEVIGNRIEKICMNLDVPVYYCYQDIKDIPIACPKERKKPWGTGHAILCAKEVIKEPFIVINADDYYGKEGFKIVHNHLIKHKEYCMAGFILRNTLSSNGSVTRGICEQDKGYLSSIVETKNIISTKFGTFANGVEINDNVLVSMNMWGFIPNFLDTLELGFEEFFLQEYKKDPLQSEFLIPIFIGKLLRQKKIKIKVLPSKDTWYGMTYKEDVSEVKEAFKNMLKKGIYLDNLYEDL